MFWYFSAALLSPLARAWEKIFNVIFSPWVWLLDWNLNCCLFLYSTTLCCLFLNNSFLALCLPSAAHCCIHVGIFTGVAGFISFHLPLSICSIAPMFPNSCRLLMTAAKALCTSTLSAQVNTCPFDIIIFSSLLVSSLMISVSISESFSLCMNCSFHCLSIF